MLFFKQWPVSYNTPYEKIGDEVRSLADEVPFDIPDSWEWVRLGNISSYAETKQKVNATSADPSIWGLDLEDIEKGGRLLEYKTVGERKAVGDKTVFTKGDILYSKVEHIKLGHLDLYSKGGKLRRIYIPKALQNEALSWLNDKHQESGFIFLNKYGDRITTRGISGQLKKLAVRYGIDPVVVYPHSFRHRFAKSFLERCNDIAFLADLMGHESIETTRIYLRKTSTEQRAIVDEVIDW